MSATGPAGPAGPVGPVGPARPLGADTLSGRDLLVSGLAGLGATVLVGFVTSALMLTVGRTGAGPTAYILLGVVAMVVRAVVGAVVAVVVHATRPGRPCASAGHWVAVGAPVAAVVALGELGTAVVLGGGVPALPRMAIALLAVVVGTGAGMLAGLAVRRPGARPEGARPEAWSGPVGGPPPH